MTDVVPAVGADWPRTAKGSFPLRGLLFLGLAGLVVAVDQVTKRLADDRLRGQRSVPVLDDVLRAVVEQNATLHAARAKWQASRERVPQEAAWEDLRVEVGQTLHRFPKVPPDAFMDTELMIEQSLPVSGKQNMKYSKGPPKRNRFLKKSDR